LVASYFGYRGNGGTTWKPPSGMSELGDASNGGSRSGSVDSGVQATAGSSGAKTATASAQQDYAIATLSALRPGDGSPPAAPTISAVQAGAITPTSATITWSTDQVSDTQVQFGQTPSYGASTPLNSAAVTSHSANLSGLAPNTVYHYRAMSPNAAGQPA